MDRIADSRADLDVLVALLEGEYPPTARDRRYGTFSIIGCTLLAVVLLSFVEDESPWITAILAAIAFAFGIILFAKSRDTYAVEPLALTKRSFLPLGSWSIPLAEIAAIDLAQNGDDATLVITTSTDKRRQFQLREAAQQKLEGIYPERFGKTDYSALTDVDRTKLHEFHTGMLRKSAIVAAVSFAAIVLQVNTKPGSVPSLVEVLIRLVGNFAPVGVVLGGLGVAFFWFKRKMLVHARGTDERLPVSYRWVIYAILAAIVIAMAVAAIILNSKGLTSWS